MTKPKAAGRSHLVRPCANCPFRTDVPAYLTPARVAEIEREVVRGQKDFFCHATVDYTERDTDEGEEWSEGRITRDSQRCAGMAILCEKIGRPSQMMRIEERLGMYDARAMDMDAPVFESFAAMRKAQGKGRR